MYYVNKHTCTSCNVYNLLFNYSVLNKIIVINIIIIDEWIHNIIVIISIS